MRFCRVLPDAVRVPVSRFRAAYRSARRIPLGDPELCTVLSNLADNAFEAVQKVPEGERFITFTGSRRVKWLTITVENSYDGVLFTDRGSIVTRKEDRVMHGLGLKSICSIVDAVPGASVRIEPSPEEKIFRVTLFFPRPQAEKKNSDDSAETQA